MELETSFIDQKWNILKELSRQESSPLLIADLLKTSIANISQQLRLLEAMNLVKKKKISNRDKGKPRTIYSLNDEFSDLIVVMNGFAKKKIINLTEYHKRVIKIWFIGNNMLHAHFQNFLFEIEGIIRHIDAIIIDSTNEITDINIFSQDVKLVNEKILKKAELTFKEDLKNIVISFYKLDELESFAASRINDFISSKLIVLHDKNGIITEVLRR